MKKLFTFLSLGLLTSTIFGGTVKKAEATRVAYVNSQDLTSGSHEWTERTATLEKKARKEEESLKGEYQKLQKIEEELQKPSGQSEFARKSKQTEAMQLRSKIEVGVRALQETSSAELQDIQRQLAQKVTKAAEKVMAEQGWDAIEANAGNIIALNPKFDVTKDVLKNLNEDFSAERKIAAPSASTKK